MPDGKKRTEVGAVTLNRYLRTTKISHPDTSWGLGSSYLCATEKKSSKPEWFRGSSISDSSPIQILKMGSGKLAMEATLVQGSNEETGVWALWMERSHLQEMKNPGLYPVQCKI